MSIDTQAIILAGGLGTRLRSAVPDLPKCMAPVAGKPFLHHVIAYLLGQGVNRFIFSLGYMHDLIEEFVTENYPQLDVEFVIEATPLGTGGAIRLACEKASSANVLVLNGDTLFKVNIATLLEFHTTTQAACTLVLKPMKSFDRYGVVEIDHENRIQSFKEKKFYEKGLINGGVYSLHVKSFLDLTLPEKFSFEKDYLEKYFETEHLMGIIQEGYFIDIGIPEDFEKAGIDLKNTS